MHEKHQVLCLIKRRNLINVKAFGARYLLFTTLKRSGRVVLTFLMLLSFEEVTLYLSAMLPYIKESQYHLVFLSNHLEANTLPPPLLLHWSSDIHTLCIHPTLHLLTDPQNLFSTHPCLYPSTHQPIHLPSINLLNPSFIHSNTSNLPLALYPSILPSNLLFMY